MERFVFFEKNCCSIQNKPWFSQFAEEIKPITVICPLEDENLKILTLELVPSRMSKKSIKTTLIKFFKKYKCLRGPSYINISLFFL